MRFTGVIHCDHRVEGGRVLHRMAASDVMCYHLRYTQTPDSNNAGGVHQEPSAFGYGIIAYSNGRV